MPDHYARTFPAVPGNTTTTITLDAMPYGAGRMIVTKLGGATGDLWLSVGHAPATVGAPDVIVIPSGVPDEMVFINGLLQRVQHTASYPDWSFTVYWAGAGGGLHVEVLDVGGLVPSGVTPPFLMYVPDLMYDPAQLMYQP
jgi:hypothetical protein